MGDTPVDTIEVLTFVEPRIENLDKFPFEPFGGLSARGEFVAEFHEAFVSA